jgi:hypothetical protein
MHGSCIARKKLITFMRKVFPSAIAFLVLITPSFAQAKHVWVLRSTGEMVDYDPATFAVKQRVKLPQEALKSPANISVNAVGQVLFAPTISLPLSDEDAKSPHKIWLWDGKTAATIDQGVKHGEEETGSNQAITEEAPVPYLSADGKHLFWFANQQRRLQREEVDLSTETTWQAWRTDLSGSAREELASLKLPECRCKTGTCEESCPSGVVWAPPSGVGGFFLMTQYVAGQTTPVYKASARYQENSGKWSAIDFPEPLQRVLDASPDGKTVVEAIPDTGCCGWSNQSNDQTLVIMEGKKIAVFDELATYRNADYDVSFYSVNARLAPDSASVAMTLVATAQSNKPIQISEQGQANPEESQRIRKALADLPAVVLKSVEDSPRQISFLPHGALVGWISDKELLIVENHLLVVYNTATKARRKSAVRVEDAAHVYLR